MESNPTGGNGWNQLGEWEDNMQEGLDIGDGDGDCTRLTEANEFEVDMIPLRSQLASVPDEPNTRSQKLNVSLRCLARGFPCVGYSSVYC